MFTPSNDSWLNWIECEFTALRYFTLDGTDYPSHTAQETAIARYIRWANRHTTPKRHYAVDSKIRSPRPGGDQPWAARHDPGWGAVGARPVW